METQKKGTGQVRISIIIPVLDSHKIVERQIKYFNRILPYYYNSFELIIVDDGSEPPIHYDSSVQYQLHLFRTFDKRPWSQPCARNAGAKKARGEYLFMTDIDHIISREAIESALNFNGDKMVFPREWAILDHNNRICRDPQKLSSYGLINGKNAGSHANTFLMKKSIFEMLGGYKESFCGKYGGDDTDFARRYGELHYQRKVARSVTGPRIFVYPEPRQDVRKIFHSLRR